MLCKQPWKPCFCNKAAEAETDHISSQTFSFTVGREVTGETWQGCSEEASRVDSAMWVPGGLTRGVLFSRGPTLNLATEPVISLAHSHTKAVSSCSSPLASLAPSAAWHSCSVSSRASGWEVSMMAMVSPSSVHMMVC